jgi:cation diffusion facilitator family transporter
MTNPPNSRIDPRKLSRDEALRRAGDVRLRALRLPFTSNIALVLLKFVVWFFTGSVSVLSEAVHSISDLFVTVIQIVAVRLATRPADRDHHYGHGKFENLSAALQGLFIAGIAAFVVTEAVNRLRSGYHIAHIDLGIGVMILSALVNTAVSVRTYYAAEREDSPALFAQASELRADVITAVGIAAGLTVIRFTGVWILDPIIALVVAGLILKSAYEVGMRAVYDLTDVRLPPRQEALIRAIIDRNKNLFASYHKLRTRGSGAGEFIDFHLQMPSSMPLKRAHDLSDKIVADIKQEMPRAHVLIHLEPEE